MSLSQPKHKEETTLKITINRKKVAKMPELEAKVVIYLSPTDAVQLIKEMGKDAWFVTQRCVVWHQGTLSA
jgi:hypothetical protein